MECELCFAKVDRKGFTVVEWGGASMEKSDMKIK